ncbi:MAG: hypothetical protein HY658_14810, partial [Actinobacteria bacterium]|nr:hypothetical protein [Actinomycetota bacterium]
MRSRKPSSRTSLLLAASVAATVLLPGRAWAQVSIDPTATPTRGPDNFVNWMAYGGILLGAVVALLVVALYLRYSARFFGKEEERGPRAGRRAPPVVTVGAQAATQPRTLAASPARPPLPVRQGPTTGAAHAGQAAATATAAPPRPAAHP